MSGCEQKAAGPDGGKIRQGWVTPEVVDFEAGAAEALDTTGTDGPMTS